MMLLQAAAPAPLPWTEIIGAAGAVVLSILAVVLPFLLSMRAKMTSDAEAATLAANERKKIAEETHDAANSNFHAMGERLDKALEANAALAKQVTDLTESLAPKPPTPPDPPPK